MIIDMRPPQPPTAQEARQDIITKLRRWADELESDDPAMTDVTNGFFVTVRKNGTKNLSFVGEDMEVHRVIGILETVKLDFYHFINDQE